jgi:hypothetical protein
MYVSDGLALDRMADAPPPTIQSLNEPATPQGPQMRTNEEIVTNRLPRYTDNAPLPLTEVLAGLPEEAPLPLGLW